MSLSIFPDAADALSGIEKPYGLSCLGRGDESAHDSACVKAPILAEPLVVLSPVSGSWGVSLSSWMSALVFFAGLVAATVALGSRIQTVQPWPEEPTRFAVIFEPAQPPLEPVPATRAEETPPSQPEPPSAPDETTPPETVAAPAPVIADAPPPPPAKPPRPHPAPRPRAATAPTPAAPAEAITSRPVEPQLAAALPPISHLVAPPRPVGGIAGNPKPVYPVQAAQRGWEGMVLLRVEVSPAGKPLSAAILTSSGHSALDEAARSTVLEDWRFEPATENGTPVAGEVSVPIQFRLE